MTDRGRERRKFERLSKHYRMELSAFTFPLTNMRPFEVTGIDISTGGLAVRCLRRFDQGEKVQVKIFIPGFNKYHPGFFKVFESDVGQYFTVVAEIAWVRQDESKGSYLLGLEFLDIYEDDLTALHNLIRNALG